MPALHPDLARFLGVGLSVHVGALHADGWPELTRAVAHRVLPDHRLALLLPTIPSLPLLEALRQGNGLVATVFCQPSTHRTVQIKGREATLAPADLADWVHRHEQQQAFTDEIRRFGFDETFSSAWFDADEGGLQTITFTPTGAWNQTPGPGAGSAMELFA